MATTRVILAVAVFLVAEVTSQVNYACYNDQEYYLLGPQYCRCPNEPVLGAILPCSMDWLGCSRPDKQLPDAVLQTGLDVAQGQCRTYVNGAKLPVYFDRLGCSRLPEYQVEPEILQQCTTYVGDAKWPMAIDPLGYTSSNPPRVGLFRPAGLTNRPSNVPTTGYPSTSRPTGGLPSNVPTGGLPGSLPGGVPTGGLPSNVPTAGLPGGVPTGGLPSGVPTGGAPGTGSPSSVPSTQPTLGGSSLVPV